MQLPQTPDYYWDLGVEETATLEDIRQAYNVLENKYFNNDTELLQRVQHDSLLIDSALTGRKRARAAYEGLSQPSERAKYDKDYAKVRAAWFRYRKWTEWQEEDDKPAGRECISSDNKLMSYSRKLMNKMRDRKAQQLTVVVDATPQDGRVEEVLDNGKPEKEQNPQLQSKTPRITETTTGINTTESNSQPPSKRVRQPRKLYVDSYPQKRLCFKGGHCWQGWWPAMEAFVSPACLSCQLFASGFYCPACNATVCLTCRLAQ
ncbi:hypothetical protein CT0861_00564 [Colletotrichum tofieldiae]|uniref:J domain-containing protein n=1 Tax=Colletotrichum tofieldiae TaxID=708197 RepID=A0A166PEY8_9PEZI|nr:hypothetical protein CT0861_00564 [Colletotrichum tofieldiae]